jgi:hypothetical protein
LTEADEQKLWRQMEFFWPKEYLSIESTEKEDEWELTLDNKKILVDRLISYFPIIKVFLF